jgi:hypothetical protein
MMLSLLRSTSYLNASILLKAASAVVSRQPLFPSFRHEIVAGLRKKAPKDVSSHEKTTIPSGSYNEQQVVKEFPASTKKTEENHFDRTGFIGTEVYVQFLGKQFAKFTPADRSIRNAATCIMNDTSDLDIPLIGFNCSQACADAVKYTRNEPGTSVRKEFLAFVCGRGGGKTRSLVEMENFINRNYSDCCAISITFNSRWESLPGRDHFSGYDSYVLYSVSSRMLSMYYGLSLLEIDDKLLEYARLLKATEMKKLFQAVICLILSNEKKKFLILQVDESKRLVDALSKLFPFSNSSEPFDYWGVLRAELLGTINCGGLVMSSLNLDPLGKSSSGRSIIPIDFPERLSSDSIVNELWLPLLNKEQVDDILVNKLKVLASSVNGLPRLVHYIYKGIRVWQKDNYLNNTNYDLFLEFILTDIKERLNSDYLLAIGSLSPDSLFPVVCNYPIVVGKSDNMFFRNLISSVYTNVINEFPTDNELSFSIYPEVSFLRIMATPEYKRRITGLSTADKNFFEILFSMYDEFQAIIKQPELSKIGQSLETIFYHQLRLKFCCLFAITEPKFQKNFDLQRFFCLEAKDFERSEKLNEIMNTEILIPPKYMNIRAESFSVQLNKNPALFMDNLISLYRPREYVQVIQSVPAKEGDCFDLLIILKTNGLPLLIFIENKSASEQKPLEEWKLKRSKQYQTFQENIKTTNRHSSDISRSISSDNMVYIYATTHNIKSQVVPGTDCLLLGRETLAEFLKFVFPIYQTARTAFDEK